MTEPRAVKKDVDPAGGLQDVTHDLGTEDVVVTAFRDDTPVTYGLAVPISPFVVEVLLLEGTTHVVVTEHRGGT